MRLTIVAVEYKIQPVVDGKIICNQFVVNYIVYIILFISTLHTCDVWLYTCVCKYFYVLYVCIYVLYCMPVLSTTLIPPLVVKLGKHSTLQAYTYVF